MKKALLIAIIALTGLLFTQCGGDGQADQADPVTPKTPVQTMILKPRPFNVYIELTGTLEARNHIQLIVEEGGTLNKILKDKGHFVRKGDTLAILENKILEASYNEAKASLQQATLDYNSKEVLFNKRAISENEYLSSKYGLQRAQAAYQLAKARYTKLFITAPLSGYVNDRFYDLGAYAMPMSPIFDFIDNAYMKINAGIAERFIKDIRIGTPVEISFDALPGTAIQTKVTFVNRSIDPQSRTFKIEIEIPNPKRKLVPQMIANLKILRRSFTDQIVIPLDAVIESELGQYVFVVSENKVKKMNIQYRAVYEDSVLVDGLQPGEELVVFGQQELTDGDEILVVNE